jgi:hypothetical protein
MLPYCDMATNAWRGMWACMTETLPHSATRYTTLQLPHSNISQHTATNCKILPKKGDETQEKFTTKYLCVIVCVRPSHTHSHTHTHARTYSHTLSLTLALTLTRFLSCAQANTLKPSYTNCTMCLHRINRRCSVLQCAAVCCSVRNHHMPTVLLVCTGPTDVHCRVLQCVAACCSVLQCLEMCETHNA